MYQMYTGVGCEGVLLLCLTWSEFRHVCFSAHMSSIRVIVYAWISTDKHVSDAQGIKEWKHEAIPDTLLKVFHLLSEWLISCLDVMTRNMLQILRGRAKQTLWGLHSMTYMCYTRKMQQQSAKTSYINAATIHSTFMKV